MSQVAELLKEASKLDRADRVELISSLLEDLDPNPHQVSDEEVMQRLEDLKAGRVKVSDNPAKVIDEVIAEVRAIKRAISERHGNDIDRLLASLIDQERCSGVGKAGGGEDSDPCPL